MPSIDFLTNKCSLEVKHNRFGLCDDVDLPGNPPTPAYTKPYEEEDWIATVEKDVSIPSIIFTAIDHCVITTEDNNQRPEACDCMLVYNDSLIFIELKDRISRAGDWQGHGLSQLFSTIVLFKKLHDISVFRVKKAYLSNKARPAFPFSNKTEKNRFEDNTGFGLLTETTIIIN